ncbi:uncharacterized protein LODBEIA_P27400 [Lodderomyces beijingensis]|uniref:Mannosyl transferase n=1 Tax=Lodderomyces beijingensis TaxID=1775926 RepID=A0ABP0ZK49_9ASCO
MVSISDSPTDAGVLKTLLSNEQLLLFGGGVVMLLAAYLASSKSKSKSHSSSYPADTKSGAARSATGSALAERKFGHWEADHVFKLPIPPPFENWDMNKTKPQPYRAFKHKYHVTMGIRNMDWDSWIELDNEWQYYHDLKLQRLQEKGEKVHATSSKAVDASWEVLYELCAYLPHRYPSLFSYDDNSQVLKILATGETFDLKDKKNLDPIVTAAKCIQDDIAIMVEDENGDYSLESGCVALAGFWRITDKYQRTLDEIHLSGDVPQYATKLGPAMRKFFRRLTVNNPVVRNNYFIQTDNNLDWSTSIGPETKQEVGWYTAPAATDVNDLYFRSERQSLRRLPISGALVFTIRTYFMPITKLCQEPYVPRRLLNGINSWQSDVEEYKGYHKFKDVLMPYLLKKAEEQEAEGLNLDEEPEVYPF